MIEVIRLHKEFEGVPVLKGIDLTVEMGEVLAIMGSSGGGKTTLLKCICGLIPVTKGKVMIDDIDVSGDPEEAREHLGLVFQNAALFDYLTVRDNILFGVKRRKNLSHKEQEALLEETLALVGLSGQEDKMPAELSGGMRKRVGLARAIVLRPSAILYDEPTTGLDPVTAYSIDGLIVEMQKELGVASIVVTHDVTSVFRVANKIAFLEAGELTFLGSPEEFEKSNRKAIQELVQKSRSRAFY